MVTGSLAADSKGVLALIYKPGAETLAVTVALFGNKPSSKPSSVGVIVTLEVPAVIGLVNVLVPTVTVTLVACGSMSVTVIPVGIPPSPLRLLVTVGRLGRTSTCKVSRAGLSDPSIAERKY